MAGGLPTAGRRSVQGAAEGVHLEYRGGRPRVLDGAVSLETARQPHLVQDGGQVQAARALLVLGEPDRGDEVVRFVGDGVAMVVARTASIARTGASDLATRPIASPCSVLTSDWVCP